VVPDLLNRTLTSNFCSYEKGDKIQNVDYQLLDNNMIGKPYQIPIYILHFKSPDLVFLSFPFGFGIDDKTAVCE
jgi:hypothetical protein